MTKDGNKDFLPYVNPEMLVQAIRLTLQSPTYAFVEYSTQPPDLLVPAYVRVSIHNGNISVSVTTLSGTIMPGPHKLAQEILLSVISDK